MSILSTLSPDRLSLAICTDDVKGISKAPGIGTKTAMRIVLELKDKISKDMMTAGSKLDSVADVSPSQNSALSEATEALMVLGYDKSSVLSAIKGLNVANMDSGEIIKNALKKLARG